jgi:general secretion pathway protein G
VDDVTDPQKKKLRFLRRIPADPMYPRGLQADKNINPEDTWGKRSYDSDADNPREGSDVYDVYSLSTDTGMNGIAYGQW